MAGNGRRATLLASIAILGVISAACGRVTAPGARQVEVIRDPDNSYWAGSTPATTVVRVIRDPDNPLWTGVWTVARPVVPAALAAIHDPDNPYWLGR